MPRFQPERLTRNRADLIDAGNLLFGPHWQSELARALNLDARRVREWVADEKDVPAAVWIRLVELLDNRANEASQLARKIERVEALGLEAERTQSVNQLEAVDSP